MTDDGVNSQTLDHYAVLEPQKLLGNRRTLYFLTSLFFLKLGFAEDTLSFVRNVNTFRNTDSGRLLNEVSSVMVSVAVGTEDFRLVEQARLALLLDRVDNHNPRLLPAVLDPELSIHTFLQGDELSYEAFVVHESFKDEFQKHPTARKLLVERYGSERPMHPAGASDEPHPGDRNQGNVE